MFHPLVLPVLWDVWSSLPQLLLSGPFALELTKESCAAVSFPASEDIFLTIGKTKWHTTIFSRMHFLPKVMNSWLWVTKRGKCVMRQVGLGLESFISCLDRSIWCECSCLYDGLGSAECPKPINFCLDRLTWREKLGRELSRANKHTGTYLRALIFRENFRS